MKKRVGMVLLLMVTWFYYHSMTLRVPTPTASSLPVEPPMAVEPVPSPRRIELSPPLPPVAKPEVQTKSTEAETKPIENIKSKESTNRQPAQESETEQKGEDEQMGFPMPSDIDLDAPLYDE